MVFHAGFIEFLNHLISFILEEAKNVFVAGDVCMHLKREKATDTGLMAPEKFYGWDAQLLF